jgi:hypothetical protein
MSTNPNKPHNLDINTYSLEEMFSLFDLTYDLTEKSMRAAKMKVLMIHPDKSRLPSEYFLFYKQAYEVILDIYKEKNKMNVAPMTKTVYVPEVSASSGIGNAQDTTVSAKHFENAKGGKFNDKFNELYETNMTKKVDQSKHDWFKKEDSLHDFSGKSVNSKNMGEVINEVKQKQAAMTVYGGVKEMRQVGFGTSYYETEDDSVTYAECDIFGKLKFDDVRKVHRDQTVFTVSEKDYANVPQYKTVDQYINERDKSRGPTMSKEDSNTILEKQQREYEQIMMQKQQRDLLLRREYDNKQKTVQAAFMQIGNGSK